MKIYQNFIKLQSEMISQQNSQDEQGFIAAKLIPKVSDLDDIRDSKGKQCKTFSAFYLPSGLGNMKLEIPSALEGMDHFNIEQECLSNSKVQQKILNRQGMNRNSSGQSLEHPYRIYGSNPFYKLVYSKTSSEQPIYNEFQYIKNDILLQAAQTKNVQSNKEYGKKPKEILNILRNPFSKLVKSFDYPATNNMTTQNSLQNNPQISRNNSYNNNDLLVFDSRFQSGNLYCVYYKPDANEYHLFIENDTNSYGYNQWFYFSLSNIRKDQQYNFVIVNFKKKNSFFRNGYKPIVFSQKYYQENGNKNGWTRKGTNIKYEESHITTTKFFKFYKMAFTLKFHHEDDYALVAANLPYSFSKLSNFLEKFAKSFRNSKENEDIADLKISPLGRTFCGNNVPQIRISPIKDPYKKLRTSKGSSENEKKMIIFLARQHPGETVSSFLMERLLQNLSNFSIQAEQDLSSKEFKEQIQYLLKNYHIVIYPMLNIDGVVYGNSRCDATGMDLNRRWKNPSQVFHPQIYNIKNKIEHYSRRYQVVGCFDLHGHSKLYNVFCYSCKINPISCRILPFLISRQTDKFYFPSCTFGITKYKSTTARATIFKTLKNQNVLTIQMSYFGYSDKKQFTYKRENTQRESPKKQMLLSKKPLIKDRPKVEYFQPSTFNQVARGLLKGLTHFLNKQNSKTYEEVQNEIQLNLQQILQYEKINHQGQDQKDSGSESDPQGDEIDFQIKLNTILGKQFMQEAQCFKPSELEEIDTSQLLHKKSILFGKSDNPIHTRTLSKEFVGKQVNQEPKQEHINKIRITKRKPDEKNRKTFSNQKFKSQLNFNSTFLQNSKQSKQKKDTIEFSVNKNFKINTPQQKFRNKQHQSEHKEKVNNISERLYSQNRPRLVFGQKKRSQILIHEDKQQEQEDQQNANVKVYDDLIIYSAESKEMINYQKSNLLQKNSQNIIISPQNNFFIRFQKFLPSHPLPPFNKKQKLSFLEESLYKDDQRQVLNTLLENKKKLEKQKRRQDVQKSSTIAERFHYKEFSAVNSEGKDTILGIRGTNGHTKQEIIDFKKFRDKNKLKMQLKQVDQAYQRHMRKQGFY